ncbi:MAG: FHA domain-containing protein [Vicinamibacterales bacterium]
MSSRSAQETLIFRTAVHVVFGDCEFDSGQRVLLRHGTVRPLSPKAFQLLEFLLDRRPEAIAKTEILARLWPETFVSDGSLHNLVAEVRVALGDAARAARYIRTVPRYGYAFHGDARPASAVDVETSRRPQSGPYLVSRRREWRLSAGPNVVGRDPDCTVRIDSTSVSRRHAGIVVTNGEATVEDLGSKNGTFVNGQRVEQSVALKDRDQIRVGSMTITYRIVDTLPSTLTQRRV